MKIHEFFILISRSLLILVSIFIIGTFIASTGYSFVDDWIWIFEKLNLRKETNFATWFESVLFVLCSLSFVMIGWSKGSSRIMSIFSKYFFRLTALASFFFSADEVVSVHEHLGVRLEQNTGLFEQTALEAKGFSWVLLYAPVVLIGLVVIIFIFYKLISKMPGRSEDRRWAFIYVALFSIGIPSVIVLEVFEGFYWMQGSLNTFLPCFEESLELITLCSFIACNTLIARAYQL